MASVARSQLLGVLAVGIAAAQSLRVYSEFQRIDPFGNVVAIDKALRPREILSPAVIRNAYASFHIAMTIPTDTPAFLYIQQNPDNFFQVTVYKERHVKNGDSWIPDILESVKLPHFDILPQADSPIPGQSTIVFWLDLWAPADARVGRMRLEVSIKCGEQWLIYPMEFRVLPTVLPKPHSVAGPAPPIEARADTPVYAPWRSLLCRADESGPATPLTVRRLIRRNALQDVTLAQSIHRKVLIPQIEKLAGAEWCQSLPTPKELGAEWYLRLRDFLYGTAH